MTLPLAFEPAAPCDGAPHWISFSVTGFIGRSLYIDDAVCFHLPRPSLALERMAALEQEAARAAIARSGRMDAAGCGLSVRVTACSPSVGAVPATAAFP